jgi:hypothetical protein
MDDSAGDNAETLQCTTGLGLWTLALDAPLVKRLRQWPRWYSSLPLRASVGNRDGRQSLAQRRARMVHRSPTDERPAQTVAESWTAVLECCEWRAER